MTDLAVIMSVYKNDNLNFVKEAVRSILDQSFTKFHYYIIFDGPVASDVDNYISSISDKRIRRYRLETHGGLANALNYLLVVILNISEYKLIARMDADDISISSRFEIQRKYLLQNSEISCVGSWYEEIDESGHIFSFRKLPIDSESLRKLYFTRTPFAHPSVMYRKKLIEKSGYYPVNTYLMEDNALWGNALKQGLKFANIPQCLIQFRIDKSFYKRRSGIKYGLNYIRTKFAINLLLDAPLHTYFYSLGIGVLRMCPSFLVKHMYQVFR